MHRRGRLRLPVRARPPPGDAPRRAGAARARRAHGLQPARPADQPGRRAPPGDRRVRARSWSSRSPQALAALGCEHGDGRARRRRASTSSRPAGDEPVATVRDGDGARSTTLDPRDARRRRRARSTTCARRRSAAQNAARSRSPCSTASAGPRRDAVGAQRRRRAASWRGLRGRPRRRARARRARRSTPGAAIAKLDELRGVHPRAGAGGRMTAIWRRIGSVDAASGSRSAAQTRSLAALAAERRRRRDRRGQARVAVAGRDRARRRSGRDRHGSTPPAAPRRSRCSPPSATSAAPRRPRRRPRAPSTLPLLCKDFFVDSWQVTEARVHGADAILVILALVERRASPPSSCRRPRISRWTRSSRCTTEARAASARSTSARRIIGVNARDLRHARDRPRPPDRAPARRCPRGLLRVAESGIETPRPTRGRARRRRRRGARRHRADARPRAAPGARAGCRDDARQDLRRHARRGRDAAVAAGADLVGFILVRLVAALRRRRARAAALREARARRRRAGRRVRRRGPGDGRRAGRASSGSTCVQLHGTEPRGLVERYGVRAIRGVRNGDARRADGRAGAARPPFGVAPDAERAATRTGARPRPARDQPVLLAGALDPDNVGAGGRAPPGRTASTPRAASSPRPGVKDHDRVRRFVAAAKEAACMTRGRRAPPDERGRFGASAAASCPRP